MNVIVNGEQKTVEVGLLRSIDNESVTVDVQGKELCFEVETELLEQITEMADSTETVLLGVDMEERKLMLDAEPVDSFE